MSVFSKYQRNMSIDWGINTKDFPFAKCSEMPLEEKIPIFGFFITPDTGYGEGPVLILEDKLLNLPQRYVEEVKNYMNDPDVVAAVKAHTCGIYITTFESKKYKKQGFDIEFIEL